MGKKSNDKRSLLKHVRKQRLKYIAVLPSLITLLNGIFGFAAITFASRGFDNGAVKFRLHDIEFTNFGLAGLMIFFAMIADMLDGRVARMSHSTSSFGGQLDSLCDMISFGVAPAFLMLKVLGYEMANLVEPANFISGFIYRFIWLSGAIYISCCAIRLARFNVENEEDESAHMFFTGIPSPAAAGVLASLVVFMQDWYLEPGPDSILYRIVEPAIVYSLPFITVCLGILMVSRVYYPHVVNQYLRGKKPLTHLVWSIVAISLVIWSLSTALMLSFCGFALFGFLKWLFEVVKKGKHSKAPQVEVAKDEEPASDQQ